MNKMKEGFFGRFDFVWPLLRMRAVNSFMSCIFSLLFFVCAFEPAKSENDLARVSSAYLEAAFPAGEEKLRKISDVNRLGYRLTCASSRTQKCRDSLYFFQQSVVSNPNMMLEQRESGKIEFVLSDQSKMVEQAAKLSGNFAGGKLDRDDKDCQLFMKFDGDIISMAAVLVSLDAGSQKISVCLLVNFYRSLGLHLKNDVNFDTAWAGGSNSFQNLAAKDFTKLRDTIALLEYIHACPKMVAGMDKGAVARELSENSICFKDTMKSNKSE